MANVTSITEWDKGPSLASSVYEILRRSVLDGRLAPGARLVERDLARSLSVSRVPVREALQRLAREGLVDLEPRRGAFVHVHTAAEIVELFEVREILESGAARLAASRRTPEQLERIRSIHLRSAALFEAGDHEAGMAATIEFHQALTEAANNATLENLAATVDLRMQWTLHRNHDEASLIQEHLDIIEALEARNGALAEHLVRWHTRHGLLTVRGEELPPDLAEPAPPATPPTTPGTD